MNAGESTDDGRERGVALKEATSKLAARIDDWRKQNEHKTGEEKDMNGFNRVVLMGRLTRDPEPKQIAGGNTVADLGLAISEAYKKKNGEFGERVCFVDIVVWGRQAENCAQYLKKGSPVLVEGRLQLDRWESTEGQKRSKHRVKADRVQFLNGNGKKKSEPKVEPELAAAVEESAEDPF